VPWLVVTLRNRTVNDDGPGERFSRVEADSIRVLDSALEAMEHSVDILKACVSGLKYRVGLQVSAPENLGHLVGSGKDVIGTSLKPR
jgi:hypothetical protein